MTSQYKGSWGRPWSAGPLEEAGLGEGSFGPKINCVRTRLQDKCRQGERVGNELFKRGSGQI